MKKRSLTLAFTGIMAAALLMGCGKRSDAAYEGAYMNTAGASMAKSADYSSYDMAAEETMDFEEEYDSYDEGSSESSIVSDTGNASNISVNSSRKLIRTVDISVEALDYEKLMADVKQRVNALGGYFESLDESGDARKGSVRYSHMTIRVPKDRADELIRIVEEEGNITNRSENVTDVTLDYSDKESHKKVLLAEQERLLSMMEQAETIEDMITIESRLSEVRYQIESMESQLRTYDNKIDYTTVYLTVNEVEKITPVEEPGFFQRVKDGFAESCEGAVEFLQDVAAWFIINIPYLILWAAGILIFIFLILKPMLKKAKINGEKARKEREEFQLRRIAAQSGNYIPSPTSGQSAEKGEDHGKKEDKQDSGKVSKEADERGDNKSN